MARSIFLALCVMLVAACPSDGPEDQDPAGDCVTDRGDWQAEIDAVDHTCSVDADCALVGGISPPTCNGGHFIADQCEGESVRASSLSSTDLRDRALGWSATCASAPGLPSVADCAPGIPRCVAGTCAFDRRSCFPSPDAG